MLICDKSSQDCEIDCSDKRGGYRVRRDTSSNSNDTATVGCNVK